MTQTQRTIPLIDTHAHLNLEDFEPDLENLIARSRRGVMPEVKGRDLNDPLFRPFLAAAVCPAVDLQTSRRALDLAKRYPFLFAACGVHPNHLEALQFDEWEEIKAIVREEVQVPCENRRLVALGETGLDRYWDVVPFYEQLNFFLDTIDLASELRLPIIIHSRDANDDLDAVICNRYPIASPTDPPVGVVHSFTGTPEQGARWIERGFYLGFGGFVTYENKKYAHIWETAKQTPNDRFLLETDCPFLTPHPLRGKLERNEPLTTVFVAKRLALLRDSSIEEIANLACQNARRLFNLPCRDALQEDF